MSKQEPENASVGELLKRIDSLRRNEEQSYNNKQELEQLLEDSTDFFIEDLPSSYRLHNVPFKRKLYVVEMSKRNYKNSENGFKLTLAVPLWYAIFNALFKNRDSEVQQGPVNALRELIQGDFEQGMVTNTTFSSSYEVSCQDYCYRNIGLDEHIHTLVDPREKERHIILRDILLGTGNGKKIQQVFKWLTGRGKVDADLCFNMTRHTDRYNPNTHIYFKLDEDTVDTVDIECIPHRTFGQYEFRPDNDIMCHDHQCIFDGEMVYTTYTSFGSFLVVRPARFREKGNKDWNRSRLCYLTGSESI